MTIDVIHKQRVKERSVSRMSTVTMEALEAVASWCAPGDAVREIAVSSAYVNRLIHDGRLRAVRTRLGYLIDPASVATYAAERRAACARLSEAETAEEAKAAV